MKAIDYCQSKDLVSATDFRDTLTYFKNEPIDNTQMKVILPLKYRVVTADVRSLSSYGNLCAGSENV